MLDTEMQRWKRKCPTLKKLIGQLEGWVPEICSSVLEEATFLEKTP